LNTPSPSHIEILKKEIGLAIIRFASAVYDHAVAETLCNQLHGSERHT
jgi:hypothetical protein